MLIYYINHLTITYLFLPSLQILNNLSAPQISYNWDFHIINKNEVTFSLSWSKDYPICNKKSSLPHYLKEVLNFISTLCYQTQNFFFKVIVKKYIRVST